MDLMIKGFSSVSDTELIYIDGGRNSAQVAIGVVGLVAIGGLVVLAVTCCPEAINKGTVLGVLGAASACVAAIASGW